MSIEAWIKLASCPGNRPLDIVSKHRNVQMLLRLEADCKAEIEWTIGGSFYDLSTGSSYNDAYGTYPIDLNTWYHLVAIYDGSRITLYVNGQEVKSISATGSIVTNSLPVVIGAYAYDPSRDNFNGLIDSVRIYRRALSSEEILSHYESEKGRYQ